MMLLCDILDFFLKCLLHLVLGTLKLLNFIPNGLLIIAKLSLKFIDVFFLVTSGCSLTHITLSWVLQLLQLNLFLVSETIDVIHLWLFSEDFITELHDRTFTSLTFDETSSRIYVFNLKDHQTAIFASCEKEIVVVTDAHSLNSFSMGLHFIQLLN